MMKAFAFSLGTLVLVAGSIFAADQPVVVTNTVKQPVPVVGGAGITPYQFSGLAKFGGGDPGNPNAQALPSYASYTVTIPAGKKLVIESVTVSCAVTSDDFCRAMLRANNSATEHVLAMTGMRLAYENGPSFVVYLGTFSLRAWVGGGQVYELLFSRGRYSTPAPAGEGIEFSVGGYLVDAPAN